MSTTENPQPASDGAALRPAAGESAAPAPTAPAQTPKTAQRTLIERLITPFPPR